jgi:hypothetical protein
MVTCSSRRRCHSSGWLSACTTHALQWRRPVWRPTLQPMSPPPKTPLLEQMGLVLLLVQTAEDLLRLSMTFVIQKAGATGETLLSQETEEAAKTIGYFLVQLRHRVDVDPAVDAELRIFLELRNTFVHRLRSVPGWGLAPDQYDASSAFVLRVASSAWRVIQMFAALIRAWQNQIALRTDFDEHPVLQEIERAYGPVVEILFQAKT